MDPVVVNSSKSVNSDVENDDKDPKFKVGDHVRTSKLKNNFAKDYTPNQSEEALVITKVENTLP